MDHFDKEYKKRFEDAQSLEGVDADALWKDIEVELDATDGGGNTDFTFPWGLIAFLLLFPLCILFLKKSDTSENLDNGKLADTYQVQEKSKDVQTDEEAIDSNIEIEKIIKKSNGANNTQTAIKPPIEKDLKSESKELEKEVLETSETTKFSDENNEFFTQNTTPKLDQNSVFEFHKTTESKSSFLPKKKELRLAESPLEKANSYSESGVENPQISSKVEMSESVVNPSNVAESNEKALENAMNTKEKNDVSLSQADGISSTKTEESSNEITNNSSSIDLKSQEISTLENEENSVDNAVNSTEIATEIEQESAEEIAAKKPIKPIKESRLKIGLYGGTTALLNQYNSSVDKPNLSNILKDAHSPEIAYSAALELRYAIRPKLEIISGVELIDMRNEFNFERITHGLVPHPDTNNGSLVNGFRTRTIQWDNQFTAVSIPLLAGTSKQKGAFTFGVDAGIGLNFLIKQKGKSLNGNDEIAEFLQADATRLPYKKTFLSYQLRPSIAYEATKNISFVLQPNLRYNTHGTSDFYGLEQRSFLIELRMGVMYKL